MQPEQPLSFGIEVVASDFAKQFILNYPNRPSGSETFEIPVSASYSDKQYFINVSFANGEIDYTYRR